MVKYRLLYFCGPATLFFFNYFLNSLPIVFTYCRVIFTIFIIEIICCVRSLKANLFSSSQVYVLFLMQVMPAVVNVMKEESILVTLVKPQFEARRSQV